MKHRWKMKKAFAGTSAEKVNIIEINKKIINEKT